MNLLDKVGETISQSVDFIIEKNRQTAQLNRLKAIMQNESEALNNAYISLGKLYLGVLEGKPASEADIDLLRENVENAKLRLKKARARYEYTLRYGIPKPGVDVEKAASEACGNNGEKEGACASTEDEQDITIAYADPTAAVENDAIDADPAKTGEETING